MQHVSNTPKDVALKLVTTNFI